jgi:hypothetical protein
VSHEESDDAQKSFLLRLFTVPTKLSRFTSLVVTLWGYKADVVTPAQLTSSNTLSHCSSTSFLMAETERKIGKTNHKRTREGCFAHGRLFLLFLLFHGRVELAYAGDHARSLAKSCESGTYDNGGASYLSCSCGSCVPCSGGGIHRGVLGILRVRIWHALALIPLLAAAVLDTFGGPVYCSLCDPVQGLHGDCAPLRSVELLLPHLATTGLGHGSGDVVLRGHLCLIWARN